MFTIEKPETDARLGMPSSWLNTSITWLSLFLSPTHIRSFISFPWSLASDFINIAIVFTQSFLYYDLLNNNLSLLSTRCNFFTFLFIISFTHIYYLWSVPMQRLYILFLIWNADFKILCSHEVFRPAIADLLLTSPVIVNVDLKHLAQRYKILKITNYSEVA